GGMDSILLGVMFNFGTVLEPEVLSVIDNITKVLEGSDNIKTVMSITNMDYIIGTDEGMAVIPILEDLSSSSIEEFKKRLVHWKDVYEGTFLSKDSRLGAIIIQPVSGANDEANKEIYDQILKLTEEYKSANLSFPVAGLPLIKEEISRSLMSDLIWLIPVAALLIIGILYLSFKRLEGVFFPMIGLAVAVIWVMGLIGFLGITFTMATLLVPVLLLVVGSAYGIHVMSHFYEDIDYQSGYLDFKSVSIIINKSLKTIMVPVILAGLTTAGGFVSLVSSPLGPFRTFGVLSAVGVVFSQLVSLILIPTLLRLRYGNGIDTEKYHMVENKAERIKTKPAFVILEKIVKKRKVIVLLLSIALFSTTFVLIPKITVGTDTVKFFTPHSRVVKDITIFNEELSGSNYLSIMISATEAGDILNPLFLSNLEKFESYIATASSNVGKVQTIVPSIKRINKFMNQDTVPYAMPEMDESVSFDFFSDNGIFGDDSLELDIGSKDPLENTEDILTDKEPKLSYSELAEMLQESYLAAGNMSGNEFLSSFLSIQNFQGEAFNEIPVEPEKYGFSNQEELKNLIAQYLVLYSGNLDMIINDSLEPDKTLITIQLADISQKNQKLLISNIESFWDYYMLPDWNYVIGGGATIQYVLSNLVTQSQYISLIAALLVVWLIVTAMFKSPLAGIIGLVPVFFALAGIFLFMILFQFNLDIITSLLASLAIGIGVDYSIHIMNAYKRNIDKGDADCLNAVYRTTGKAVFINAVSVAVGFLSLTISGFVPIRQMGILFAVSMIFASLSSLIVLPIILNKLKPKFLIDKHSGVTL
ncbi:MAG: MMPL family transporter, partial [Spirochaetota bacterium]|nr:MMPL family transporter [Spirochaetota bacterium]